MCEVRISSASMRQLFHPCTAEFISATCKAACCRTSSGPIRVALLPREEALQEAAGLPVGPKRLAPGQKRCPNQEASGLCSAHGSELQPFGCQASPFILTSRDTLVVRNRYRLLKCFRAEGAIPAFLAHRASLRLLFGEELSDELVAHLEAGGGDRTAEMLPAAYEAMVWLRDEA